MALLLPVVDELVLGGRREAREADAALGVVREWRPAEQDHRRVEETLVLPESEAVEDVWDGRAGVLR